MEVPVLKLAKESAVSEGQMELPLDMGRDSGSFTQPLE